MNTAPAIRPRHRDRPAEASLVAAAHDVERLRREAAKLRRKIERARERGQDRRVKRLTKLYLCSFAGRVDAVAQAAYRVRQGMSPERVLETARRVNVWQRCGEQARLGWEPKPDGGARPVTRFGLMNQARQILVREPLRAAAGLSPHAYDAPGRGVQAGGREILDSMDKGYKWAVVVDVARCFESFSGEGVAETLSPFLPREVTRNVLTHGDRLSVVPESAREDIPSSISSAFHTTSRPAGLPQGSRASNLVASVLLSGLADALPGDAVPVLYRDDVLVLVRTRREADAVVSALVGALYRHPAGRLTMKRCEVRRVADGFEFLGYNFRRRGCATTAVPKKENVELVQRRAMLALCDDLEARRWEPDSVKEVYRSWLAGFPLWEVGEMIAVPAVEQARRVLRSFNHVPPPRIRRRPMQFSTETQADR